MDSYVLYGPGGASPVQLASWIDLERGGANFGNRGMLQQGFVGNTLVAGGQLSYEQYRLRSMEFPLLIGSHSTFGGLVAAESLLRLNARPGGWLDVQPDGVPSTEAIRFDLVSGRYEEDYQLRIHAVSRRRGTLYLQTQPLGYWPTWITLASSASVGLPGGFAIPGGSIIGDAPGALRLFVAPTTPTSYVYTASHSWRADFLAWTLGARGASMGWLLDLGGFANSFAPGGNVNVIDTNASAGPTLGDWALLGRSSVMGASGGAVDYRGGRYRIFGFVRQEGSQAWPHQMSAELVYNSFFHRPSSFAGVEGLVATVVPDVHGGSTRVLAASPAFGLYDFGEHSAPLSPSGASQTDESGFLARLWYKGNGTGLFNTRFDIGPIYALRIDDGVYGVLREGLSQPTISNANVAMTFHLDTFRRRVELGRGATTPAGGIHQLNDPLDVSHFYYGAHDVGISPSVRRLDIITGARQAGLGARYVDEVISEDITSGWHLPYYRFNDGASTVQFAAPFGASYGPTGIYLPTGASGPGAVTRTGAVAQGGELGRVFGGASAVMVASGVYLPSQANFSMEWWAQRASNRGATFQAMIGHGTFGGSWRQLTVAWASPAGQDIIAMFPGSVMLRASTIEANADASYHHYVYVESGGDDYRAIFRDGSVIASANLASYYLGATGTLWVGGADVGGGFGNYFAGAIDEVAVMPGGRGMSADRVTQHFDAGRSATGGPTVPMVHNLTYASVQVEYRPRFQFLKGI